MCTLINVLRNFYVGKTGCYTYDYSDKKANSGKVPKLNGDPEEFSWWKTNFYSYIMGLDEEL